MNMIHRECAWKHMDSSAFVVLLTGKDVVLKKSDGAYRLPSLDEIRSQVSEETQVMAVGELDGKPCVGIMADVETLPDGYVRMPCRESFLLSSDIMNAVCRARMFILWRRQHRYCGGCGAALELSPTDLALSCPICHAVYYPQLAPAVITAVTRNHSTELLMAHNKMFSGRVFSLIAGFVEAGETLEQAVQREIMEETGIRVKNITYLSSQPWPFPNSLMMAFKAEYDSGEAKADGQELEELGWFTRDKLPECPAPGSVAHKVIVEFFHLDEARKA